MTPTTSDLLSNRTAANLAGVSIDELRVTMPALDNGFSWTIDDNLVLNPVTSVPEPGTTSLLLLGAGVLVARGGRRLKTRTES